MFGVPIAVRHSPPLLSLYTLDSRNRISLLLHKSEMSVNNKDILRCNWLLFLSHQDFKKAFKELADVLKHLAPSILVKAPLALYKKIQHEEWGQVAKTA